MLVSYSVKVRIIKGKDLLSCDINGYSDPYCKVWVGFTNPDKKGKKTHTKKTTLNPEWDETFVFPVTNPTSELLTVEVWDWDTLTKDDAMGGVKIPLTGLVQGVEKVAWYPMSTKGEIEVGITAVGFDSSGLSPAEVAEIFSKSVTDATQVQVFQPPIRWQVEDPEKFYVNNKHNNASGWIQLSFDKPYYIGGESIHGRVVLFLNKPVPAKAVMIMWKGTEKSYIENTVVTNDEFPRTDVYHEKKVFFNDLQTLFSGGNQIIPQGQHCWNFVYNLPPSLPSIFYEKYVEFDGDKIKAAISYNVKVFVDMPGSDIKAKENLIISELLTLRVLPIAETKVKAFAFTKGKMKFTGHVGKNVFIPGEVIPLHVKLVNPTKKQVSFVKVKLIRKLSVKANHFRKDSTREVTRWKFPGVSKQVDWEGTVQIQLPEKIYPSSTGHLVTCSYKLEIELDIPMAFDVTIRPNIVIALLPAPGQGPQWLLQDMSQLGGWKSF